MPHSHDIGGLALVTPGAGFNLSRDQWALLELAFVAQDGGEEDFASELVARIEQDLGVTAYDRLVVALGGVDGPFAPLDNEGRLNRRAQRQMVTTAERRRIRALIHDDTVELNTTDILALQEAEAARLMAGDLGAQAVKYRNRGDHAEARKLSRQAQEHLNRAKELVHNVETDRARRARDAAARRAVAETRSLAESRGEKIVEERVTAYVTVQAGNLPVERKQTALRLRNASRDGLETLRTQNTLKRTEGINQIEHTAGMRYREQFEYAQPSLRAGMGGGGAGGGNGALPMTDRQLVSADWIRRIEQRVQTEAGSAAVPVLRAVAGEGKNLSEIATSGSARSKAKQRLRSALGVVADALGIY
jgi:hypothetical protein